MNGKTRQIWLRRVERIGRAAETALLTVLLLALILIAFGQILMRNVLASGVAWADGGSQLLVLWIAVVGALAATRDRRHLSINLAGRLLPDRWRRPLLVLVDAFAALVSGAFAWQAARFVADSRSFGDVLLGSIPAWWLQAVLPVGFVLVAYRFGVHALGGALERG